MEFGEGFGEGNVPGVDDFGIWDWGLQIGDCFGGAFLFYGGRRGRNRRGMIDD